MKISPLVREFRYNGLKLPDPNPSAAPEAVCAIYAGTYPELNNATVEGPDYSEGLAVYTLKRGFGVKG